MDKVRIPGVPVEGSRIIYGCMTMGGRGGPGETPGDARRRAEKAIRTAIDHGITMFDHADIYGFGRSEELFGEIVASGSAVRDRIIVQSKCGIRRSNEPAPGMPGRYDFSKAHILASVDGSLRRLRTDRLDVLLLHRPDPLCEPEEVAAAFEDLHRSGKVLAFGVSNHTARQIELLKRSVRQGIIANQVQLSLLHSAMIAEGILANTDEVPYTAAAGTLDYCRLNDITIQAWAPVAGGGLIDPPADAPEPTKRAAAAVAEIAGAKGVPKEAVALGWLLRHPAGIQPIIGTTNPERIRGSCREMEMSREEWYGLLAAARGKQVP